MRGLARILHAHRLLEVGGGRDPLFKADELKALGIEMTINDISQTELDVLPASYHKACFDVAGDISAVAHLRDSFDLAFSRMVFEHVADGQRAWSNLYQLLAPGGVALAFVPTLYALPVRGQQAASGRRRGEDRQADLPEPHRRRGSGLSGALQLDLCERAQDEADAAEPSATARS